jgi:hypothetical protein
MGTMPAKNKPTDRREAPLSGTGSKAGGEATKKHTKKGTKKNKAIVEQSRTCTFGGNHKSHVAAPQQSQQTCRQIRHAPAAK